MLCNGRCEDTNAGRLLLSPGGPVPAGFSVRASSAMLRLDVWVEGGPVGTNEKIIEMATRNGAKKLSTFDLVRMGNRQRGGDQAEGTTVVPSLSCPVFIMLVHRLLLRRR